MCCRYDRFLSLLFFVLLLSIRIISMIYLSIDLWNRKLCNDHKPNIFFVCWSHLIWQIFRQTFSRSLLLVVSLGGYHLNSIPLVLKNIFEYLYALMAHDCDWLMMLCHRYRTYEIIHVIAKNRLHNIINCVENLMSLSYIFCHTKNNIFLFLYFFINFPMTFQRWYLYLHFISLLIISSYLIPITYLNHLLFFFLLVLKDMV